MKPFIKVIAALSITVPVAAAADPLPKAVSDMECLVGSWKGGGSLAMGKDKAKINATWTCTRTSAQFGVSCTFRVTGIPGVAVYEETDLMGYEPNTNLYHWYSVTNAGETHDHVAKVPTGNTIQFVFNGTQEGKPFKEVIDLTFSKDERTVRGRAETFVAGTSTSFGLGGRERKVGAASERARTNVQRRIAHALEQVRAASPRLGEHLTATIRTGTYCVYDAGR